MHGTGMLAMTTGRPRVWATLLPKRTASQMGACAGQYNRRASSQGATAVAHTALARALPVCPWVTWHGLAADEGSLWAHAMPAHSDPHLWGHARAPLRR